VTTWTTTAMTMTKRDLRSERGRDGGGSRDEGEKSRRRR